MFFEGKSSQKHLGNIYKFFEKRNSFAGVTTWQSSNIGCFFVFARHGRALTGASPEYAQIAGSVQPNSKGVYREVEPEGSYKQISGPTNRNHISYVLVFKLSRFGRNAADVLATLQVMQDFGVNLICVEDGSNYKDFYYYGCKHRNMSRGRKCDYKKQVHEEMLDVSVTEVIVNWLVILNFRI